MLIVPIKIIFFTSLFLIIYIYAGYPLVVKLLSKKKNLIVKNAVELPTVSVLIPAYNEEKNIEATILNKIALEYPRDKIEVIVVSDGSTDNTDEIVENLAAKSDIPIKIYRQPRKGKSAGLNLIVPKASGDILVFSDANSMYSEDVLEKLVQNFSDPSVGYVTGKMVYVNPDGSLVGDGCSSYMKYENWLRDKETHLGSIVGVDGGIDAMRRSLYEVLGADQLPDLVQPLKVVEKGYRVIYEPGAILKEKVLNDSSSEYQMRVRVALRALWALRDMKSLLNPLRFGVFSLQLLSHKTLRYLAFVPIIAVLLANVLLIGEGQFYLATLILQLLFYLLAWKGMHYKADAKIPIYFTVPYYFTLLNLACLTASVRYIKGEKMVIWKPRMG
jgi:cellulose synthase/poly-beta-1,6-N-acetylglucosamine synthase-like glycosyltransferase